MLVILRGVAEMGCEGPVRELRTVGSTRKEEEHYVASLPSRRSWYLVYGIRVDDESEYGSCLVY
jgi:hypothetical protein